MADAPQAWADEMYSSPDVGVLKTAWDEEYTSPDVGLLRTVWDEVHSSPDVCGCYADETTSERLHFQVAENVVKTVAMAMTDYDDEDHNPTFLQRCTNFMQVWFSVMKSQIYQGVETS